MENEYLVLALSFFFTFAIDCIPIILYRYKFKKYAIKKKKALVISVLYCVFTMFIMFLLFYFFDINTTLVPEIMWAYINYRILTKPGANDYQHYGNSTDMLI